ncbi:MAG: DinB family protein [Oceanihabitans sp.]
MLNDTLIQLFKRDLEVLINEIKAYKVEENLWKVNNEISNSAGNLCLHLVGNLNHFIGATIGNSGYVRNRELEFSQKHVPREVLVQQVEAVLVVVENTLKQVTQADLQKEYKRRATEKKMTLEYFLVHLSMHLAYHLGQINYHRRFLDGV